MCKSLPRGTDLGGMKAAGFKGSERADKVWHCERTGRTIGDGAASVAMGTLGTQGTGGCGVGPVLAYETSRMCCRWQRQRRGAAPDHLDPREL